MNILRITVAGCVLAGSIVAIVSLGRQSSSAPQASDSVNQLELSTSLKAYPGKFSSMRAVDFKEMVFRLYGHADSDEVQPKAGRYSLREQVGFEDLFVEGNYSLPSREPDLEYSLVVYYWETGGGSSTQTGVAQVFCLDGGVLRAVQQLDWDEHVNLGHRASWEFDAKNGVLLIRAADPSPDDANCCVSAVDVSQWEWDGMRFKPGLDHRELSEFGIEHHMSLDSRR